MDRIGYDIAIEMLTVAVHDRGQEEIVFEIWWIDDTGRDMIIVFFDSIVQDIGIKLDRLGHDLESHRIGLEFFVSGIVIGDDIVGDEDLFEMFESSIERIDMIIKSILDTDELDTMLMKRKDQKRWYLHCPHHKLDRKITRWIYLRSRTIR